MYSKDESSFLLSHYKNLKYAGKMVLLCTKILQMAHIMQGKLCSFA